MIELAPMSYILVSDALDADRPSSEPRGRALRWGLVLGATIALHGAALLWFAEHRDTFAPEVVKPPVQVALLTAQPIARAARERSAAPAHERSERSQGRNALVSKVGSAVLSEIRSAEMTYAGRLRPSARVRPPASVPSTLCRAATTLER